MFGRKRRKGCRTCGPDEVWTTFDSRGRPYQQDAPAGPGIGPDLKAYSGPDRRANYIGGNDVNEPITAREAPPQVMSPLPYPPPMLHVPAMTAHPYEYLPYHGSVELEFPSPAAWIDPGHWNIDPQRIDWRRPEVVEPGSVTP
jgi:hypothetical protein